MLHFIEQVTAGWSSLDFEGAKSHRRSYGGSCILIDNFRTHPKIKRWAHLFYMNMKAGCSIRKLSESYLWECLTMSSGKIFHKKLRWLRSPSSFRLPVFIFPTRNWCLTCELVTDCCLMERQKTPSGGRQRTDVGNLEFSWL